MAEKQKGAHGTGALLDQGRKALAAGRYPEAGEYFEAAVRQTPKSQEGWLGLGEVALAIGQQDTALDFCEEALRLQPDKLKHLERLGTLFRRAGKPEKGIALLKEARKKAPKDLGLMEALSGAYAAAGDWYRAREVLRKLTRMSRASAGHYCLLGLAEQAVGELDDAILHLKKAVAMDARHVDAWLSLCVLLRDKNREKEAEECLPVLLRLDPKNATVLRLAGEFAMSHNNHLEAAKFFREAISLTADSAALYAGLCLALVNAGRAAEALDAMQEGVKVGVPEALILEYTGYLFTRRHQTDLAEENLKMCLERDPDNINAMNILSVVYSKQGKSSEAKELAEKILQRDPKHIAALINLGGWYIDQARADEALDSYRRALELDPHSRSAYNGSLWVVLHSSDKTARDVLEVGEMFERCCCRDLRREDDFADRDRDSERRLKIGWVSADMFQHPVAAFVVPFLGELDRRQVEVFMYHNTRKEDHITGMAKARTDHWREVLGLGDDALATLIRDDEIDILIDLSGNTEGHRLLALARKPAPIQVTWLGYPGTSGMSAMDYIFVPPDSVLERGEWCSETPWALPDCYGVRTGIPDVAIAPGLPSERLGRPFTFACLNNFRKVSKKAIELWSRILREVPEARLILIGLPGNDAAFKSYVEAQFAVYDIAPERLDIRGMVGLKAYFENYNEADLCLDPFPFNGGTTGYDSIWMGVPFVTWPGDMLVSRMGRAILINVGLSELVAESEEEYVRLAVELAHDHERLKTLRAGLRERMLKSPLMDAPRMARGLEGAFRAMWRRWCEMQRKGFPDKRE
ncbi:MAG: tetratricopeptide repeat protein [Zoogloeaceae bacterium]|jgi:predicted O-linked N-acetylglucosamine transferase (SPINDLY family)|nr:tetratricopeptide repeat protein [Zoogloeaceae bacterium]